MTTRADLSALLGRVQAATGPDEALAADLCRLLISRPDYDQIAWLPKLAFGDGVEALGAAVALVEQMLPGVEWKISSGVPAMVAPPSNHFQPWATVGRRSGVAPIASLAVLAALLSALIAQEANRG